KERKSETYKSQIKEFEKQLDSLFDIAHANAFDIMKIEIDKEFLRSQRMPGRPEKNKEATKRRKYEAKLSNIELVETPAFTSSEEEEDPECSLHSEYEKIEYIPGSSGVQRATKSIMTSRLSAALDKCKVSDRIYTVYLWCLRGVKMYFENLILSIAGCITTT
ncbi:Uncharacterized protein FWK35_00001619, partial [Aphis craccivora]